MEAALISVVIIAATIGPGLMLRSSGRQFRPPWLTVILATVTFVTSAVGNVLPGFLDALDRSGSRLSDGQWWRIVSPLVVQDGGWPGTIFNIVALLVLGAFVESLWTRRTLMLTYLAAGITSEVIAYTFLQHQGFAGNSVAVMGLAALLGVTCARFGPAPARLAGAIALLAGIILLVTANLHGVGFAVGAIIGCVVLFPGFERSGIATI